MPDLSSATIDGVETRVYRIPTDAPEADGTIAWTSTTMVVVHIRGGGRTGLGYTYGSAGIRDVIVGTLAPAVEKADVFDIPRLWQRMVTEVRNVGWRGIAASAISAVDTALWDLKAKLIGMPLVQVLGASRDEVPIYGSGGFTTYTSERLADQLGRWVRDEGCRAVKMKVGNEPRRDPERIACARDAIGEAELYIDANGALERKEALAFSEIAAGHGVTWFEEPISSDDLEGLRLLRDRAPSAIRIVAGEYGYDHFYFRRMLAAGAVDVLQADATRCGGFTGFLKAATLAEASSLPLSAHTAPALHLHVAAATPRLMNVEWFHDHARLESMLFDGSPVPRSGAIRADLSRPGIGLELKTADAERFAL